MHKTAILTAFLSIAFASIALADGRLITSVKFDNKTAPSLPLSFTPQKVKWQYEKTLIWAAVKNTGKTDYKSVAVSFTALDKDGNFLGRVKWYVDPAELSAGESGNIDSMSIETEGRIPSTIEFTITGNDSQ